MTLNGRPYPPQKLAQAIRQRVLANSVPETPKGMRGVIIGLLNDICNGDEGRYCITEFLFGTASTKALQPAHWYALKKWIDPAKPGAGNNGWAPNRFVQEECYMVLDAMGYNIDREEILKKKSKK